MLQIVCGDDFEFSTVSANFYCTLYWQTKSGLARAGRREEEEMADGLLKRLKTLPLGLAQR